MASRLKSFIASLQSKLGERKKKWDLYIISLYILGFEIGEKSIQFHSKSIIFIMNLIGVVIFQT